MMTKQSLRRSVLPLALFLTCLSASSAQVLVNPKIGFSTGLQDFTYLSAKWEPQLSFRLGADFRIGRHAFRLIPGVHYEFERFNTLLSNGTDDGHSLHAIHVPVYAAYYLTSRENPTNILVRLGVNGNLVLGEADLDSDVVLQQEAEPLTVSVGGGITIDLAVISIDLTYLQGLNARFDVSEEKGGVIQLAIGFLF